MPFDSWLFALEFDIKFVEIVLLEVIFIDAPMLMGIFELVLKKTECEMSCENCVERERVKGEIVMNIDRLALKTFGA